MTDSGEWILKIISGPHQGAEVALRPGRVVAGTHSECDLVLHDVLVAPHHFALTLGGSAVTVEALEGPVFCNGKRVAGPAPVPPFGFVTAGTTHLVVGPAGTRWPLLSIADVPLLEKESVPAAGPSEKTDGAAAADPATDKKHPKSPTAEQRRRALWTAGIGGALLLVWIVLWVTWAPHAALAPRLSARERAEQVLRTFPDAKTIQLDQQGDRLVATGYVSSDATQRDLAAALREDAPEVAARIWSTPRMVETARSILSGRNLNLEVAAGENGELLVRGSARSSEEWTRTRRLLLSEVPGLTRVKEELSVAPAKAAAPSGPAALGAPPVAAGAIVSPTAAAAAEPVFVIALQELGGGQGWLRLSNGTVLFRGAHLPEGGSIVAFREDRAIIEHSGARFALAVGAELAAALRTPLPAEQSSATALPETSPVAPKENPPQNG